MRYQNKTNLGRIMMLRIFLQPRSRAQCMEL